MYFITEDAPTFYAHPQLNYYEITKRLQSVYKVSTNVLRGVNCFTFKVMI